jgi:uncharacterized protein (DUF2235 family)
MARKIVIFADGTGNTVGDNDSNVLRLCKMIDCSDKARQVAIYDPGVGTLAPVETLRKHLPPCARVIEDDALQPILVRWLEIPLGLLFGFGTKRNIRRLYGALIREYEPGDEIFLFGFSRGAFTVRALAGVIYRCGVPRCEDDADKALDLSRKHFEASWSSDALRALKQEIDDFKRSLAHVCDIRFLGVWDTVKSVGYLWPRNLPHTRHNPIVETVRHALALGERRSFYAPTTWGGLDGDTRPAIYMPAHLEDEAPAIRRQDVQEVWFPGDHSDVGGSHRETALADVSLHWMVNEAYEAGLRVDLASYSQIVPNDNRKLSRNDVHDQMTRSSWKWRILWRLAEYCPRRDIDNEPPPPKFSLPLPNPLGPRLLQPTARQTFVSVHSAAKRCYCENSAPWKGTKCRFVDTTERVSSFI